MFRHRYNSAKITFKCNLKLTEVRWGSGTDSICVSTDSICVSTDSICVSRIYDTIEIVSNNRTVLITIFVQGFSNLLGNQLASKQWYSNVNIVLITC